MAVFPAGEVSYIHLRQLEVADSSWDPAVARLVRLSGAQALPVFFEGSNSVPFHAMSRLRPSLRTAWLLSEFLGQAGKKVEVRIGSPISASAVGHASSEQEAANYLRWRTYLLAQRGESRPKVTPALPSVFARRKSAALAQAVPLARSSPRTRKIPLRAVFGTDSRVCCVLSRSLLDPALHAGARTLAGGYFPRGGRGHG